MGHYSNVNNAKDILAALFMQAGNPIVKEANGVFWFDFGFDGRGIFPQF